MLLDNITSTGDLRALSLHQLPGLACEVRDRIIEVVAKNGGHLASSLGAVELIIALHYCLNTPRDKIIFDVGHQAYAHKILTGRNSRFDTLRQMHGISGFPSKEESEYDPFTSGHSSNAVSLALGLACARDLLTPEEHFKVVAVIGDGSLSGGLCFEGLNNAGHLKKDMLVVLNTNELSIAPNVGAISNYLNKIISLPIYNRFKESLESFMQSRMPKGSRILKLTNKFEEGLKNLFIPGMLFEELGFRYFGPLDGHNIEPLVQSIKNIINIKGPRILHVVTKKGKGYCPSEKEPVRFHGTAAFEVATGDLISAKSASTGKSYTNIFGEKMVSLAQNDKRIIAITAAMPEGTGLDRFRDAYPQRFFDVGIAEAHAVTFASGLSREEFKPVLAVYSTFLQRAYDQIIEDVALQKSAVVFAIDRAGIVGEDGATHQGIFDIAYLRSVPGMVLMSPKDGAELEAMLEFAFSLGIPVAIRYPRDKAPAYGMESITAKIELGKAEVLKEGKDCAIIAYGSMVSPSLEAANRLEEEGVSAAVINARFAKPLDEELFKRAANLKKIFCVEEGIVDGGFADAVQDVVQCPVVRIGLPDEFIPHGKRSALLEKYGLDANGIYRKIKSLLG